jgi:type IV secretory pathway VirB3-like protein
VALLNEGGYAERVAAPEALAFPVPDEVSDAAAGGEAPAPLAPRLLLGSSAGVGEFGGKQTEQRRFAMVAPGICEKDLETRTKGFVMSLGVSIFLLVVGAILTFAVKVSTSGFDINVVGIILMIAGAVGLLLSLMFWSSFSPWRRRRPMIDTVYDGGDRVVEERRIERDLP